MVTSTRPDLQALPSTELARRLATLAGEEREAQVEFLLHLDAYDRRRAWLEAGYASLWDYCRKALHLREGAASRRIGAMRVLRRVPQLEAALRDGRLCLSTLIVLGPVLTNDNAEDLVARAAFLSKLETECIAVSLQPRVAPRQGVRMLPGGPRGGPELALVTAPDSSQPECEGAGAGDVRDPPAPTHAARPDGGATDAVVAVNVAAAAAHGGVTAAAPDGRIPGGSPAEASCPAAPPGPVGQRQEVRPLDGLSWSLRVTLGRQAKADLDALVDLLSHKTGRDLGAVVHEAVRCALEKHGKRRGAIAPGRPRGAGTARSARATGTVPSATIPPASPTTTPAATTPTMPTAPAAPPAALTTTPPATPGAISPSTATTSPAPTDGGSPLPRTVNMPSRDPANEAMNPRSIPAEVRRQVWARDGGRCAYVAPDGRRCGSRWRLELHHEDPAARGGPPTLDNLSLRCKPHNLLEGDRVFGPAHMARFTRRDPEAREEVARYAAMGRAPAVPWGTRDGTGAAIRGARVRESGAA
jgi:5-methylcytosine-specific restriction endonuclease McrA